MPLLITRPTPGGVGGVDCLKSARVGVGLDQRQGLEVGVDSLKVGVDQQADGADRPHHLPPPRSRSNPSI